MTYRAMYVHGDALYEEGTWITNDHETENVGTVIYDFQSIPELIQKIEERAMIFHAYDRGDPVRLIFWYLVGYLHEPVSGSLRRTCWGIDIDLSRWSPLDEKLEDYLKNYEYGLYGSILL